jgi:hypothetical protein
MNWREYFEYWRSQQTGMLNFWTEEGRYQAFKARFKEEEEERQRKVSERLAEVHDDALSEAMGPHGQG